MSQSQTFLDSIHIYLPELLFGYHLTLLSSTFYETPSSFISSQLLATTPVLVYHRVGVLSCAGIGIWELKAQEVPRQPFTFSSTWSLSSTCSTTDIWTKPTVYGLFVEFPVLLSAGLFMYPVLFVTVYPRLQQILRYLTFLSLSRLALLSRVGLNFPRRTFLWGNFFPRRNYLEKEFSKEIFKFDVVE